MKWQTMPQSKDKDHAAWQRTPQSKDKDNAKANNTSFQQ
jgi:hypothetical protein